MLLALVVFATLKTHRRVWTHPRLASNINVKAYIIYSRDSNAFVYRSNAWWSHVVLETFSNEDWLRNFRMRKETFLYLCEQFLL